MWAVSVLDQMAARVSGGLSSFFRDARVSHSRDCIVVAGLFGGGGREMVAHVKLGKGLERLAVEVIVSECGGEGFEHSSTFEAPVWDSDVVARHVAMEILPSLR